jgi:hypothetical protein
MASCPKCNGRLRLIDWRQTCPHCNVNLVYYRSNDRLLDDSEKAEFEHSETQPKIDRAKAAYAGSKLTIARIVFTVLPVITLLIPVCRLNAADGGGKFVNLVSIIKFFMNGGFNTLIDGAKGGNLLSLSLSLALVSAAMFLINLFFIIASLGKHGKVRSFILYGFTFLLSFASLLLLFAGGKDVSALTENFTSASVFTGAFVFVLAQLAALVINIVLYKKGVDVKYKTCLIGGIPRETFDEYVEAGMSRQEIRRKMLIALAEMQDEYDRKLAEEQAKEQGGEQYAG